MVTEEKSSKIVNFMNSGAKILVLGRDHISRICGQVQIDYFSNVFQFDPNAIIFVNFGWWRHLSSRRSRELLYN